MLPTSREQAFVLLALHSLSRPCTSNCLKELYGHGENHLDHTLETLLQTKQVRRQDGPEPLWGVGKFSQAEVEQLATLVRVQNGEDDSSHLMGYVHSTQSLDNCEYVLKYIEGHVYSRWSDGMNPYVELVINLLTTWAKQDLGETEADHWKFMNLVLVVQCFSVYSQSNLRRALELGTTAEALAQAGGNQRFKPFLCALGLYLHSFFRYPTQDELKNLAEQVSEIRELRDPALDKLMPWLLGMLSFLRGEYQHVIDIYSYIREQPHWWYKRIFSLQALNTLYSANYLGLYHLAVGISESARNTAVLGGESAISLVYLVQHCFLQFRIRETKQARKSLEHVMHSPGYATSNVLRSLCARAMALCYYMEGDVHAAYTHLHKEVIHSIKLGIAISPFHDPFILDMLYVFEQKGYAPIPQYTLDSILETLPHAANTHLRGAALRIQALREQDSGGAPERVVALLRNSMTYLLPSGDPKELALTVHELAKALLRTGQKDEALHLQGVLFRDSNQSLDASSDYRQTSILCLSLSASFVSHLAGNSTDSLLPEKMPPHTAQKVMMRCHKAFHAFPVLENLGDMCLALVKIAQAELGTEHAALFVLDENGQMHCQGAANWTGMELESIQMQPCQAWLRQVLENSEAQSLIHPDFGLCLVLDVDDRVPWVLYMRNHMTESVAKHFTHDELQDMARLFAAEWRACLRMDKVRDAAISRQYDRLKNIVAMREEGSMPPLLGDGMQTLMHKALQVSSTDAPILLWGETGVGKEVVARKIHELSECSGPFIAIHPASMPETLFESECFGYERGAFTGAGKQKLGLFELADRGTLFIDEIGEISPLIQTKLLRVLQEKRFMRVGGTHEIASRFRLVTATNRDLWQETLEGRFRQDLLYRISVVPLKIPTLRERRQDILPLAAAFITHFSKHHGKPVAPLNATQEEQLYTHNWPGNIRELRNIIERAVILNDHGNLLHFELPGNQQVSSEQAQEQQTHAGEAHENICWDSELAFAVLPTLSDLEGHYLRYIMRLTNGHVRGAKGAAALLHIKQSTLYAKLQKYQIILREK